MTRYSIDDFNFMEDEEFQKFFHRALPDKRISRDSFIRKLNSCKREWIKILNSPVLKSNYLTMYGVNLNERY